MQDTYDRERAAALVKEARDMIAALRCETGEIAVQMSRVLHDPDDDDPPDAAEGCARPGHAAQGEPKAILEVLELAPAYRRQSGRQPAGGEMRDKLTWILILAVIAAGASSYSAYKTYQMTDGRPAPTKNKR